METHQVTSDLAEVQEDFWSAADWNAKGDGAGHVRDGRWQMIQPLGHRAVARVTER